MRILVVSDLTECPGGVHKYLRQLEIYIGRNPHFNMKILLEEKTNFSVCEHYNFDNVEFIKLSRKYHSSNLIEKDLNKALLLKPNLIHIVNGSIKSNLVIREFFIKNKVKIVVTEQFIDSSLNLQKKIISRLKKINDRTGKIIYVSNKNLKIAINLLRIKNNNLVIQNSIKPFTQKKNKYSLVPIYIYTTARCVHQKGIDIILHAISKIDYPFVFHIFGDGEESLKYKKLSEKILRFNQEFEIKGWFDKLDQTKICIDYDLFISGSREEGLSFSLIEAASLGMPIICSNTSGNDELIKTTNYGWTFESNDPIDLEQKLREFVITPTILNNKAKKNCYVIDKLFNANINFAKLEKLYLEL
jgi:glycosyltransferase involved in cell wall biosynthesis